MKNAKIWATGMTALIVLTAFVAIGPHVAARVTTNISETQPVKEHGPPVALPGTGNARMHSVPTILPFVWGLEQNPIKIWLDGVTITVSEIPPATQNENGEWEGTVVMEDVSRAWDAAIYGGEPWSEKAWVKYKFWLNGAGTVTIVHVYDDGTVITEEATKFIFFEVRYVGEGMGNSDFDADKNFDVIIQGYK